MRVDEWIIPAPAEAVAVSSVKAGLLLFNDTATVSTKYPNVDARHVKVVLTGGRTPNLVTDSPTFVFECWDVDDIGAEQLVGRVAAIMRRAPGGQYAGHFVRSWTPGSRPQNFPPAEGRMSRYQFMGELGVRPTIKPILESE